MLCYEGVARRRRVRSRTAEGATQMMSAARRAEKIESDKYVDACIKRHVEIARIEIRGKNGIQ